MATIAMTGRLRTPSMIEGAGSGEPRHSDGLSPVAPPVAQ
jgi:hypothetical protein